MFLRSVTSRLLSDRKWQMFSQPASDADAPGYSQIVTNPMDLSTLLMKVDNGDFATAAADKDSARLIVTWSKEYFQVEQHADLESRRVVSKAHDLVDNVDTLLTQIDPVRQLAPVLLYLRLLTSVWSFIGSG